jgi:hypothetical protein
MKSVSWMLLMAATGREAPARGTGAHAAAQLIRRRDGALLLAPIDARLAQAARRRAPAIY